MKRIGIIGLLLALQASALAQVLDSFKTGPISLELTPDLTSITGSRTGSMVGGVAYHSLYYLSDPNNNDATLNVSPPTTGLFVSNGLGVATGAFCYYGYGSPGTSNPLHLNLGADRFFLVTFANVSAAMRVDIAVFHQDASSPTGYDLLYWSVPVPAGNSTVSLPFSSFQLIAGNSFGFSTVDGMYLYVPSAPSSSYTLTTFQGSPSAHL